MVMRSAIWGLLLTLGAAAAWGQAPSPPAGRAGGSGGWRPTRDSAVVAAQATEPAGKTAGMAANDTQPSARRTIARVTKGPDVLPNEYGQVLREYDISPYTLRVPETERPEQAVVDWVLRETGYEAWHSEPLGFLCADSRRLRVYHTPEMQATVSEIVDRFVNTQSQSQIFGLRIVTVGNPNWRSKALSLMKPIPVQSQGVQGWLLAREDAAFLMDELRQRSDFRELSSPNMVVSNGQPTTVSAIRPRTYVRGIIPSGSAWPSHNPDVAQIEEGYTLQFTPLLSLDGSTVDAVIRLQLSQVERMLPVMLDIPSPVAPRQRTRIEVPQMTMRNVHERFRWPTSEVLLLSMGVVASPGPSNPNALAKAFYLPSTPPRADALLFVENKGKIADVVGNSPTTASGTGRGYSGRY